MKVLWDLLDSALQRLFAFILHIVPKGLGYHFPFKRADDFLSNCLHATRTKRSKSVSVTPFHGSFRPVFAMVFSDEPWILWTVINCKDRIDSSLPTRSKPFLSALSCNLTGVSCVYERVQGLFDSGFLRKDNIPLMLGIWLWFVSSWLSSFLATKSCRNEAILAIIMATDG